MLIQAAMQLDGAPVYSRSDPDGQTDLATFAAITVFHGEVGAGNHESHTFSLSPSRAAEIHVVAYEKGTLTTPIEERPAIRYEVGVPGAPSADAR